MCSSVNWIIVTKCEVYSSFITLCYNQTLCNHRDLCFLKWSEVLFFKESVWWKPTVNQFQAKMMSKTHFIINTTNREMPQDVLNNKCIWSIISFSVPTLTHNLTLSPLQQNIDLQQNTDSHLNQVTTVIDVKKTTTNVCVWSSLTCRCLTFIWPLFDPYH